MKHPCISLHSRFAGAILAAGFLFFGLTNPNEAQAAITYQAPGAVAYSSAGAGATSVAPAYPASIATGDLLVLIIGMKPTSAGSGSVTTPTGWTAITSLTGAGGYGTVGTDTGDTNVFAYYKIAAGGETGTLTVTLATNDISWAQMFRLSNATGGWSVAGTTGSDTTAGDVSITMSADPGVTAGDYILGAMVIPTDVTTPSQFPAEALTQTGITFGTVTEISEPDSGTGSDIGGFTYGAPVSSGTASAAPTLTATAGGTTTNVRGPGVFIRCRETASTTLSNGNAPSSVTIAPGASATLAGEFRFQTSSGNDTITNVTVGLGSGAGAGLSVVRITDVSGATVYGEASAPISDTQAITLGGLFSTLTATTSLTSYRIYITPKAHADMDAPSVGVNHFVTAKIDDWTGTNGKLGSDTADATITVDNDSPDNVTMGTVTTASQTVTLNWTNPGDTDFNSVVIFRSEIGAITDAPVEGTTYSGGETIGNSTVVNVTSGTTFTNTSLNNGTAYYYKIFAKDSNGNYATGSSSGPHTPAGPGCYSVATGNWGSNLTWADSPGGTPGTCPGTALGAGVPDGGTPAYINFTATSHTVTVDVSNAAATSVRIGTPGTGTAGLAIAAGTLDVAGSVTIVGGTGTKKALLSFTTGTLKVGGTITESGATDVTFGTGTVEYDGTGNQTVANYGYHNLTINKSAGTASPGANITIGNNLTVTSGTLDILTYTVDRGTAGGTAYVANGATLRIGGGGDFPANYTTVSPLGATSTVAYYGASFQPVTALTYGHLELSGAGRKAPAAGTITVAGNFSIASGTECDADVNDPTFNIAGNFTNNGTFTPGLSTVVLNGTAAQSISGVATTFNNLTISNSAGVSPSVALTTNGIFTISSGGVFNAGSLSHILMGNFSNSGTFNANTSTVTFNGTAAQTITGATTFYNLGMNNTNAAGLTINNDVTVGNPSTGGTLTFSNGRITTGTNTLILGSTSSCGVSGAGSGKYVVGKLRKSFVPTTQIACNFEVGDNNATTHYTPLNVSFAAVSVAGSLTVAIKPNGGSGTNETADDHPQVDAASLDSANSLNRYWMLVPAGGLTFSNATLTFTHLDDATWVDHDNSAANVTRYLVRQLTLSTTDPANCYVGEGAYNGAGDWSTATGTGTQTGTETAVTGVSSFGTYCSHFAIGRSTISSFLREREFIYQRELYY